MQPYRMVDVYPGVAVANLAILANADASIGIEQIQATPPEAFRALPDGRLAVRDPSWDRHGFGFPGRDYIVSGNGQVIYLPILPRAEPPWYVRELGLILRDTSDGRVIYETSAKHEGRWADDEAVLPAMFAAALQGFPKPPEGRRLVNIEIPR